MEIHHEKVAERLFRKYYSQFSEYNEITMSIVQIARVNRFENDEYWSIWKKYGKFFAFIEAFFHKQDGTNQLAKIPDEDKYIFQSSSSLLENFKSHYELAIYFKKYDIKRMVNSCAEYIMLGSNRIATEFGGKVPESTELLESFCGYGRKLANMLLNLAFDQPKIAIDRHVLRSALKLGLIPDEQYKYPFLKVDYHLHEIYKNSPFLIEMDYLLFSFSKEKS